MCDNSQRSTTISQKGTTACFAGCPNTASTPLSRYLIGEKFINFLEAAEDDVAYRAEIPELVAEIKNMFEPWQLAESLNSARQTEPFDRTVYDDPDDAELEKLLELRRLASELLLVEKGERVAAWRMRGENYFSNTSSITTGVFALMECFKFAGMWTHAQACAS